MLSSEHAFGLIFPILAILIRTVGTGISLSLSSIAAAFSSDPLLWIIITAPLFLGIFAAIAGRRQDELEKTNGILKAREQELEAAQLVLEERVNERTRELTSKNQLFMERAELLEFCCGYFPFTALHIGPRSAPADDRTHDRPPF